MSNPNDKLKAALEHIKSAMRLTESTLSAQPPQPTVVTVEELGQVIFHATSAPFTISEAETIARAVFARLNITPLPAPDPKVVASVTGMNLTPEQAHHAAGVMSNWIRFVRSHTHYLCVGQHWPNDPDPEHSSLLVRMLQGDAPMPEIDYQRAKSEERLNRPATPSPAPAQSPDPKPSFKDAAGKTLGDINEYEYYASGGDSYSDNWQAAAQAVVTAFVDGLDERELAKVIASSGDYNCWLTTRRTIAHLRTLAASGKEGV